MVIRMKEINIGEKIIEKRKEKGITQEDLAKYIGVSKASVSKWETGQSYPDITTLPLLATYFDITVDELLGYSPQLTKEAIHKLYASLAEKFVKEGYELTYLECKELGKKYYSCYELQFYLSLLYVNYGINAPTEECKNDMFQTAIEISKRIKEESGDSLLMNNANSLEATVNLLQQNALEVVELLEDTLVPRQEDEVVLANAYLMLGKTDKAMEALQFRIYENVILLIGELTSYQMLFVEDTNTYDVIRNRIQQIVDAFQVEKLHPSLICNMYLSSATAYMQQGKTEEAIKELQSYVRTTRNFTFPVQISEDDFFTMVKAKYEDFGIGMVSPRDEESIKLSIVSAVRDNPTFQPLKEQQVFKSIVKQLESM
ncbi:helix-turn-helix domain-containing protein [Anaerosporobacter faecicola]|uniref:helix-turn-helix domain-containing protein n=1 Tax=Anaerosporobacter faecicola TaxID=2718714 RepID=UPI001439EE08|nr:helix-turn-helix transcriptional regulator [Anaerosporobacter faecicola]